MYLIILLSSKFEHCSCANVTRMQTNKDRNVRFLYNDECETQNQLILICAKCFRDKHEKVMVVLH